MDTAAANLRLRGQAHETARHELRHLGLVAPLITLLLALFAWPLWQVLLLSLGWPHLTTDYFVRVATVPAYLLVMANTLRIATIVTLVCLFLGYPVAFLLATASPQAARKLLALVLIPFWTGLLVRNYSWMVLLGNNGLVNHLLRQLGVIGNEPLSLLYNTFGATVGMVHILLPYMILSLYAVMRGIDRTLLRAAYGLGATPARAFLHIFLPLSLPGIAAGSLLVFIMALGFFVTPALLGGRSGIMISMVIENLINQLVNWPLGAALAMALLAVTLVLLALYNRFLGIDRLVREAR